MAELPENTVTVLKAAAIRAHTSAMAESSGNISNSNNLIRLTATKKFDEVGSIQSRAVDKVFQLPKV